MSDIDNPFVQSRLLNLAWRITSLMENGLDDEAVRVLNDFQEDGERVLLAEAKDALMAFLNDPNEAARARRVIMQLNAKLLPLLKKSDPAAAPIIPSPPAPAR